MSNGGHEAHRDDTPKGGRSPRGRLRHEVVVTSRVARRME